MAEIVLDDGFVPRCDGCGARFSFLLWGLDSRDRGPPYGPQAAARGSVGPEMARFQEEHRACPAPHRSLTDGGVLIVDRTWRV